MTSSLDQTTVEDEQTAFVTPPSLAAVIVEAIEAALYDLHTGLPARVIAFDVSTQSIVAQIVHKRVFIDIDGTLQVVDLPPITNVPVIFPGGGGWEMNWPLAPGDLVYLNFAERSLDEFLDGDGSLNIEPFHRRRHDLSDAVAMASFPTRRKAQQSAHAVNLRIGRADGSVQLELTPNSAHLIASTIALGAATGGAAIGRVGDRILIDPSDPANAAFYAWIAAASNAGPAVVPPYTGPIAGQIVSGSPVVTST